MHKALVRFFVVSGLVVVLGFALSAMAGAHTSRATPEITGVAPDPVTPSTTAQPVTVSGSHFLERLSLTVTGPDGNAAEYREPAIRDLKDTSFVASVVFPVQGAYQFVVTNADGGISSPYRTTAKPQSTAPSIVAVLPDRLTASPNPQSLTVQGQRFVPGMTVSVTDPAGGVQDIPAGNITNVRPTSMEITVTLQAAGDYSIVATLPSGTPSNSFGFRVGPR